MTHTTNKLSVTKVKALKKPGYYGDGAGLYLKIQDTGSKTWIYRFMLNGRRRDCGLGRYPTVRLAEAREAAAHCRRFVASGIDPIEKRSKERAAEQAKAKKAPTFEHCAREYIAAHEASWKNAKHRRQWYATLEQYAFPIIGTTPVNEVDTPAVLAVLKPIWTQKPSSAARLRGRIEVILDAAKVMGYRDGQNPAGWRGHLKFWLPAKAKNHKTNHLAALPYDEVSDLMNKLRQQSGIAARALEFLVLTAARLDEVAGACWDEFSLKEALWTVPPERMKGGRQHRVPLSPRAVAIIEEMAEIKENEFVFPGRGGAISGMAIYMHFKRMGYTQTIHGLRTTLRVWCAEETNVPSEVAEEALAHLVGTEVERAYRRTDVLDKRRKLMDDWAAYCGRRPSAKVVPFQEPGDMTEMRG